MTERKGVRAVPVGSGMFYETRVSYDMSSPEGLAAFLEDAEQRAEAAKCRDALQIELDHILEFVAALPDPARCPGVADPRCCGLGSMPAEVRAELGNPKCHGGRWREADDVEWWRRQIETHVRHVRHQMQRGETQAAVISAMNLGARVAELGAKIGVEPLWERGRRDLEARRAGGKATARAPHEERIDAVEAWCADRQRRGLPASAKTAAEAVAKAQPELGTADAIYESWRKRSRFRGQR